MKDYREYFAGKKVTVMGLGLLGRGVGDAALIAEAGAAEVIVTDLKSAEELQSSIAALQAHENISHSLGGHKEEDFTDRDLVLVAAGVPADSEFVRIAKSKSAYVAQSAALFAELSGIPIIGVTGTRGKSTVTMMIHHCLQQITGERILLGGNVRGVSNLQLLKDVKSESLCVMELDSWQLQGWGWANMSPQVAVFTSFMEDHLNYYMRNGVTKEEAMAAYFTDKAQIFLHQDESGTLVTTPAVFEWLKKVLPDYTLGQEVKLVDSSLIPEEAHLAMPGEHNRLNAALATTALEALGIEESVIYAALALFPGVEGRLQLVKTYDNVRVYNDNNATTPQATQAALEALDLGNQNIILIAGGADKNISVENLAYVITEHCKQVILTPGSGTDRLLELLHENASVSVVADLAAAVATATAAAKAGDIILFSPAFASFAQYKNEYERNDQFLSLIEKL